MAEGCKTRKSAGRSDDKGKDISEGQREICRQDPRPLKKSRAAEADFKSRFLMPGLLSGRPPLCRDRWRCRLKGLDLIDCLCNRPHKTPQIQANDLPCSRGGRENEDCSRFNPAA
ncbi:hypothetical protein CIHG_08742 [Coccidioides immitis H538.4]|uniref:Uncharacterized protein n=3 Tax=Coccidioides immitis TaxID=5501 RepID=A0A0J8QYA0_COCIT|nr:hypothetical protein CIRG_02687 [Coccidioides immitis RMSCC 2394]KMU77441.1 hypothetical protein CISG_06688 [Coccidioides immitis RMSCC 3703]KMU90781.1 hypothetical protein CIHG_08742 [Coccidioides immitis H538.4]